MESFSQTGCISFHREREDYLGRQPGSGFPTGQVVRRYRETVKTLFALGMLTALQPPEWYIGWLDRQDIFTAVTPANVKPGWHMYNQAHQDGLNPPFPVRHANGWGSEFPPGIQLPDARWQNTHTAPAGQALFYFFWHFFIRSLLRRAYHYSRRTGYTAQAAYLRSFPAPGSFTSGAPELSPKSQIPGFTISANPGISWLSVVPGRDLKFIISI